MMKTLLLVPFLLLAGCRMMVYEHTTPATDTRPAETRRLTYWTTGLNTEMSGLNIATPNGSVGIGEHKSDSSRALDTVDAALMKIPAPGGGTVNRTYNQVPAKIAPAKVAPTKVTPAKVAPKPVVPTK